MPAVTAKYASLSPAKSDSTVRLYTVTRCLHFTAGCTTGRVNYANERSQAALERSNQDAYGVIRLTRNKAAVWTADDVARLIEIY